MLKFIDYQEQINNPDLVKKAYDHMLNRDGEGASFLGWLDYLDYTKDIIKRINEVVTNAKKMAKTLVVIGIGGSYLGAKAIIEALSSYFIDDEDEVIFAGNNISSDYLVDLVKYLQNKDFCINVISKSGTTTEPAIAFRVLKKLLILKYGDEAYKHIITTTDKAKGALKLESNQNCYESFIIPDDIGGRYSWITPVGLLPCAWKNIDIEKLIDGAKKALDDYKKPDNEMLAYANSRYSLYKKGLKVEILATYEPKLSYLCEWWKQLFGESEGKDGKGLFPASVTYTTDLHSLGQFIQDGSKIAFETVINVVNSYNDIIIRHDENNLDGLNYLENKSLNYINHQALTATRIAHIKGEVANLEIKIDKLDEEHLGYLLYYFMLSCGTYSYMLGVNPFNQPGVEAYKNTMFTLLGKPGYEKNK